MKKRIIIAVFAIASLVGCSQTFPTATPTAVVTQQ